MAKDQRRRKTPAKLDQNRRDQPGRADDPIIVTHDAAEQPAVEKEASMSSEGLAPVPSFHADKRAPHPVHNCGNRAAKEQLFLSGLPPFEEFMQVTAGQPAAAPWEVQWHQAAAARQVLAAAEAGIADNVPTQPLPLELESPLAAVRADDVFQQTLANAPHEFRMVELEKCVVYQKHLNLDDVERREKSLSRKPEWEELIAFCFPLEQQAVEPQIYRAGNTMYVISESNDLRLNPAGPQLVALDRNQLSTLLAGQTVPRTVAKGISLVVLFGYSLNFLHVFCIEGRLVLNNGYHRAAALFRRGQTTLPCLVQTVTRDQLSVVAAGSPLVQTPDLYLKADRPPLFKDFLDPRLHVKLVNRPTRAMCRVSARFEVEGGILIH
jgi:hypothetical protein